MSAQFRLRVREQPDTRYWKRRLAYFAATLWVGGGRGEVWMCVGKGGGMGRRFGEEFFGGVKIFVDGGRGCTI